MVRSSEPDRSHNEGQGGILRRRSAYLDRHTPQSKPGPAGWGLGMTPITSFSKKNYNEEKPEREAKVGLKRMSC